VKRNHALRQNLACTTYTARRRGWTEQTISAVGAKARLAVSWRPCYHGNMIRSFKNAATEDVFNGVNSKAARKACPPHLWEIAVRKLDLLDAAETLEDLRVPPGNRLEALKGDRAGQYSIRINEQYRICFVWRDGGTEEVEIVDYHR